MNESIKQLLSLQERDLQLDQWAAEAAAIPAKIQALKAQIQGNKTALETAKKDLTQFQLSKKQKELDLEAQETSIRKHAGELNAVKTNEAYRALLGEIEKAKKEKSGIEDQILQLMDQIDQANKTWKEKEAASKGTESDLLKQISDWEAKKKTIEETITSKSAEREQLGSSFPKPLFQEYQRLRTNKKGAAVVPLRNQQCSGCHMKVSPNLVNEIRRGQKLMTCESCSRIVYLEEAGEAVSK